jgi:hypothetical protein
MKIGNKEIALNVALGAGYKAAQVFGHKVLERELFGSHELDEWLNYGLVLPVFGANVLCGVIEHFTKKELSYYEKMALGLVVVAGVKIGQHVLRSFFGTSLIEPEDVGNYETLSFLKPIMSETARDIVRGFTLGPMTITAYELLRSYSAKVTDKMINEIKSNI